VKRIQALGPGCPKFMRLRAVLFAGALVAAGAADVCEGAPAAHDRQRAIAGPPGVCPPFHLLDEDGNPIDPVGHTNADKPYSPRQTCGKCHDYERIAQGYHFTQGKGEKPTPDQAARCQWARTPGNYGGTWCSPAPLYRYLSPKKNASPRTMDMTSFSFITVGCGLCHAGGGSAEFDRDGKRYDRWMADPASGLSPGGDNGFDGDYYQARWSETGVLEADCLLCHLPEYGFAERKKQIKALNFRWAATAAAGLAAVTGSVADGGPVTVAYDKTKFNPDGTLSPHIVREPRNEACLTCHAKPGWKKRGANFRPRTDVHLRAGLKCVDCHPAGSAADDPRISGKEAHQIAKGDDPGGHVRDDLDNTMPDCADCHDTGRLGAPVAAHQWLPPLHLDRIACQTCHVPERTVKAALVQAGDVFNPGAKIPTRGRHLWTFYGPDGAYWNHYGDLEMMGYDDKPTHRFRPVLARHKDKIYPVNRVHTAWPAIETEGKAGLMQPKMGDIYKLWVAHKKDPANYPTLARITDDNGDSVPEVNRPEEIDALIAAVTEMLTGTGYPMQGSRVVWVMNDRVYSSGVEYRQIAKHPWEASPYGNVHKYNHDVFPARAALGRDGCTDCHHPDSPFFFASVTKYQFDENARPVTEPQYRLLGLSGAWVRVGAWREAYLKPIVYVLLVVLACALVALVGEYAVACLSAPARSAGWLRALPLVAAVGVGAMVLLMRREPGLLAYALPTRFWLDAHHFLVAMGVLAAGAAALVLHLPAHAARGGPGARCRACPAAWLLVVGLVAAGAAGLVMLLKAAALPALTCAGYTVFDAAVGLVLLVAAWLAVQAACRKAFSRPSAAAPQPIESKATR